jgi:putative hydrolase
MTGFPFGFGGPSGGGEGDSGGEGGSGGQGGSGQGGEAQPDLGAMLRQLGDLMSGQTGPVNWNVAEQGALAAIGADAGTTAADTETVAAALRLADVWLDGRTTLPSGVTTAEAWSRRRWLKATQPAWTKVVEPVAARMSSAFGEALPEEMRAAAAPLMGVMTQVGALMFGGQLGSALGSLATEVLGATDIGLPLGPPGVGALVPENVAAFGAGLEVPLDEVRVFVAVREAAHHRLYTHVPWLRARLLDGLREYAEGVTIDASALEEMSRELDPTDMSAMQARLAEGLFQPQSTPEQEATLARLETLLALVEGWVDAVTLAAATPTLPSISALNETMRRRRAVGGPAERTLGSLVGLEVRPRRLRDAAALWALVADRRGIEGRDALWAHPDLMPSASDLDDPFDFVDRDPGDDIDLSSL